MGVVFNQYNVEMQHPLRSYAKINMYVYSMDVKTDIIMLLKIKSFQRQVSIISVSKTYSRHFHCHITVKVKYLG